MIPIEVSSLDSALEGCRVRPRGIVVGTRLWRMLIDQERISWTRGYIEGILDSGIDLPVLDQGIFVHVDPEAGESEFRLPSDV